MKHSQRKYLHILELSNRSNIDTLICLYKLRLRYDMYYIVIRFFCFFQLQIFDISEPCYFIQSASKLLNYPH